MTTGRGPCLQSYHSTVEAWLLATARAPFQSGCTVRPHNPCLSLSAFFIDTVPCLYESRFTDLGYLFIRADYRLLPANTGHDVVADIEDLWTFLFKSPGGREFKFWSGGSDSNQTSITYKIDKDAVVVSGESAGATCAHLCVMHCPEPRPKASISMYGMGGDFMIRTILILNHPYPKPYCRIHTRLYRHHITSHPRLHLPSWASLWLTPKMQCSRPTSSSRTGLSTQK